MSLLNTIKTTLSRTNYTEQTESVDTDDGERPTKVFIGASQATWLENTLAVFITKLRYNRLLEPFLKRTPHFDDIVMGWAWDILLGSRDFTATETEPDPNSTDK